MARPDPDPRRDGYVFAGWYTEAACVNAWDFTADASVLPSTETEPRTLYAKWTAVIRASAPISAAPCVMPDGTAVPDASRGIESLTVESLQVTSITCAEGPAAADVFGDAKSNVRATFAAGGATPLELSLGATVADAALLAPFTVPASNGLAATKLSFEFGLSTPKGTALGYLGANVSEKFASVEYTVELASG